MNDGLSDTNYDVTTQSGTTEYVTSQYGTTISGANLYATTKMQTPTFSGTNVYAKTKVQADNIQGDVNLSGLNIYAKTAIHGDTLRADVTLSGLAVNTGAITGTTFTGTTLSGTTIYTKTLVHTDTVRADVALSGLAANVDTVSCTSASGTNLYAKTLIQSDDFQADKSLIIATTGSPYKEGVILKQLTAITIISGGMFVAGSKGFAIAAPASWNRPLGYCISNAGSNTSPEILIRGIAPFIANGNVNAGDLVKMGAGGARNGVVAIASGTNVYADLGKPVGVAIGDAASGTTNNVFVYLY